MSELLNIEELNIEIIDSQIQKTMGSMIAVGRKGRVAFSAEALKKLNIKEGNYVIFGKVGNSNFIAKRPLGKGLYGYSVKKPKKSAIHYVASLTLMHIPKGKYNFSDPIVKEDFVWFQLISVD